MGKSAEKLTALKVYREIESLSEEERETLLLLLDEKLTEEILLRKEEAKEKPEELLDIYNITL